MAHGETDQFYETGQNVCFTSSSWGFSVDPAEDWKSRGLCAQTDPEAFFPEKGGSTKEAKRICGGCEVRAECLQYAIDNDERFGVWGGLSEKERRGLRRGPTSSRGTVFCRICNTRVSVKPDGPIPQFCSRACYNISRQRERAA